MAKVKTQEQQEQVNVDELLAKVDKESAYRKLTGTHHRLVAITAITFPFFNSITASFGLLPAQMQRAVHLLFVLFLSYLLYPVRRGARQTRIPWYDGILSVLAASCAGYIAYNYAGLMDRAGAFTTLDIIVGIVGILVVLEACRRVVGLPILIIACSFIAYAFLGPYMPGFLNHRGYSFRRVVGHLFYTTEGILGLPLGVSSTFIFLFILFGAFLDKTGIGKFFIDIANAIAGFSAGGPAKVAVISSAMMGTISGSSVSNTVGTGSFTIPLMKNLGYKPEFAGAVEAAASTGGQLMPPIMGAAAFLMAETLGIPYLQVAVAAIIPAILYFSGIFIMVHLEAKKLGLKGIPRDQLPRISTVMKEQGHLILPLITILYFLIQGATPMKAALYGIITSVLAGMLRKNTRMGLRDFLEALENAGRTILGVAIACATAGIIIGIVTLTGLGLKMASGLVALAGGLTLPTLIFTMLASIVLGMGIPTTANYLITSTITAPAVVQLGVPVLAAHFFAFYFGIVADITPPVALAAYAGSAIARGNPFKTGLTATRLAIAAFIIPYMFALNPIILLIGATPLRVIQVLTTSLIGMLGVGAAMEGYLLGSVKIWERILYLVGGLLLIDPAYTTDMIGVLLILTALLSQRIRRNNPWLLDCQ
jgi:TRAP transporter 4TM/12TM fusion protein